MGVGKALIADHAPTNLRGRAMGIFHATVGVCGLLASLLAGLIWDLWSGSAALMFGAACAAVAFGVLLVFARRVTLNRR
ncbi:MAG TPA: hypothetical protein PKD54_07975 [Pirellulaceae bacterium]|nr:hypothetical protein [Pirellulaceae bacterium]